MSENKHTILFRNLLKFSENNEISKLLNIFAAHGNHGRAVHLSVFKRRMVRVSITRGIKKNEITVLACFCNHVLAPVARVVILFQHRASHTLHMFLN